MLSACVLTYDEDGGYRRPPENDGVVLGIHHLKGSNAVATHGQLVLRNGCVMLDLGNGIVEMLAWPSDFTVEGSRDSFRVLNDEGGTVASSGDRVELDGGPLGRGAIKTTDDHAPSKCLTDHIFAVDSDSVQT